VISFLLLRQAYIEKTCRQQLLLFATVNQIELHFLMLYRFVVL